MPTRGLGTRALPGRLRLGWQRGPQSSGTVPAGPTVTPAQVPALTWLGAAQSRHQAAMLILVSRGAEGSSLRTLTCGQAASQCGGAAPRVEAGNADRVGGGGREGAQSDRGGAPRSLHLQAGGGGDMGSCGGGSACQRETQACPVTTPRLGRRGRGAGSMARGWGLAHQPAQQAGVFASRDATHPPPTCTRALVCGSLFHVCRPQGPTRAQVVSGALHFPCTG